jgi:hypothetical protein
MRNDSRYNLGCWLVRFIGWSFLLAGLFIFILGVICLFHPSGWTIQVIGESGHDVFVAAILSLFVLPFIMVGSLFGFAPRRKIEQVFCYFEERAWGDIRGRGKS